MSLLGGSVEVASAGVDLFADELARQGVVVERMDWRPPVEGAAETLARVAVHMARVSEANAAAVLRMQQARPLLTGIGPAGDLIDGMTPNTLLHAGPPIEWTGMSGPLRGAVIGAALYEGLATDIADAEAKASSGAFEFVPCHDRGAVGPMAGVVSHSMPMWIVTNEAEGNVAYSTLNEGLGKVLRYGAYDDSVLERLRWMRDVLAPVMTAALGRLDDPVDLRAMIAQALQMGDEGHNRNRAGTSLFLREMTPALVELEEAGVADAARFITGNDHFFLNLVMAAGKATADAAAGIEASSVVVAMARNGTEFGVRLAGTGDRWFTGPAGVVDGLFLPGFGPDDANLDIGDSTITETIGLGGCAMAAAPAIIRFVGGTSEDALAATQRMYTIACGESDHYQVPALSFRGTPLGLDCLEIVHTGILPVVNTGIAHKDPGVGQVGAGLVDPPMEAFVAAAQGLAESL